MYRVLRCDGDVAQLGEHLPGRQKVTGSTPVISTNVLWGLGRLGSLGRFIHRARFDCKGLHQLMVVRVD